MFEFYDDKKYRKIYLLYIRLAGKTFPYITSDYKSVDLQML